MQLGRWKREGTSHLTLFLLQHSWVSLCGLILGSLCVLRSWMGWTIWNDKQCLSVVGWMENHCRTAVLSQEVEITGREDRSYASEFSQTSSVLRWCLRRLGNCHSWQTPTGQFGMLGELNFLSLSKGFRPSKITEGSEESSNIHCGYQQSQVQKITNIYLILVQSAKQNSRIRKSSDAKEPKLQTPWS